MADSMSDEGLLLVHGWTLLAVSSPGGRGKALQGTLYKGTDPTHKGFYFCPHELIISPKPHLQIPSLWELGFNIRIWGRHKHWIQQPLCLRFSLMPGTHTHTHTLTIVHGAGKFFTALLVSLCLPSYVQSRSPRPPLPLVPNQKLIKFSSERIYITQQFSEASGNKNYYMEINKSKENHIKALVRLLRTRERSEKKQVSKT